MQSWAAIFDGASTLSLAVEDVRVHQSGALAFVTCVERMSTSSGEAGRLAATNIFERGAAGGWVMVHHQACPAPPPQRPGSRG